MVQWSDYFWGEGNRGFEVLSNNVKNGAIAIEEFQRFLNESAQCESAYYKNLSRLQAQLLKSQYLGTFTPIWNLVRDLFDKIYASHSTTITAYQELLRELHNYQELYQKKVKAHIQKDGDITRITDLITHLNNSWNIVNKTKEQYQTIAIEYDRSKRGGTASSNTLSSSTSQDNTPPNVAQSIVQSFTSRSSDRLERKYRAAQDEYKLTIEKYNLVRNDYEKRFRDVCAKFQDFEIDHIEKMLLFSLNYSEILRKNHEYIRIAQHEFDDRLKSMSGTDILDTFVEQKKTGTDRPALLQFEEADGLRTSLPSTTVRVSDTAANVQDSTNAFDQLESGVPSFQLHFNLPPLSTKASDNNRALTPHSTTTNTHPTTNNPITSFTSNTSTTSASATASNNQMLRPPEANGTNDQTTNPFDVKIRRPKFPGIFGSNRNQKERKGKKADTKSTNNAKHYKTSQSHQGTRDGPGGVHLQNSNAKADNHDNILPHRSTIDNKKCPTPEPYTQSNVPLTNDEIPRPTSLSTNSYTSTKQSKSSSSSDSSDEEDDSPMLKVDFKIKPKTENVSEENNDTKIVDAMRLIGLSMGSVLTNARGTPTRLADMNKSVSNEQIVTRTLPPPVPLRALSTVPNDPTPDIIDQSSMFPPHDGFDRSPVNSTHEDSNTHDNTFLSVQWTSESKNPTPISSTDDDTEVANSFRDAQLGHKTAAVTVLQAPPLHQSNQQQPIWTSVSPSIASIHPNLCNSPIVSHDQTASPLTIETTDQVPLAIAFQEIIHVMLCGNNQENWKIRIGGEMLISFPASILKILADSSHSANTLQFRLKNSEHIDNIVTKSSLITRNESPIDTTELSYSFDMMELNNTLQNLKEKNPSSRFFNLNVLNYEVKHVDVSNIPINISSQWTRTFDTISVNINYRFNSSALPGSFQLQNDTVIFYTIITDGQQIKESSPNAEWSVKECKLWWRVPYVDNGTGNLCATLISMQANTTDDDSDQQREQPLTTSSIVNAYFLGENALFSSVDFELACYGYRVSLLKKKIQTGKYQSEPDQSEPLHLFQRPTLATSSTD